MKEKLVFDEGFYDRIMQEVEEMEMIAANVKKMLRDRVYIEKEEEERTHVNLDADPPKVHPVIDGILDTVRPKQHFHPADVELFYECNHKEKET